LGSRRKDRGRKKRRNDVGQGRNSKGGAPTNPDWYHNVLANPDVTVEVGTESFPARATVPERAERDRLFNKMAEMMPGFAEYQRNTERLIPVIVLERTA